MDFSTPPTAGGDALGPPGPNARFRLLTTVVAQDDGSMADRVHRALRLTANVLDSETAMLSHTAGGTSTIVAAHSSVDAFVPGTLRPVTDMFCSITVEAEDIIDIRDAARSEHRAHPCHTNLGVSSYLGVPVHVGGEVWGTLSFLSSRARTEPRTASDHSVVRLLALWIGGLLDVEEHERDVQIASDRVRDVLDQAPIILFEIDKAGTFTLSEGAGIEALGLKAGEVVGSSVFDLYAAFPDVLDAIRTVLSGEPKSWEATIGGETYATRARPVRGADGTVAGLTGVSLQITEEANARRALAESSARYQALSEATFEGIAFVDDGRITDGNDQLATLFGFSDVRELIGKRPTEVIAPEYRGHVLEHVATHRTAPYEVEGLRKDGSRFWIELQERPTSEGGPARVTAVRDISERKKNENRLRFQADVLAQVSDAVVALDGDGRISYWNQAAEQLYGHAVTDVVGESLFDVVSFETPSAEPISEDAEAILRSDAAKAGELVYIPRGGGRRFLSVSSSELHDEVGSAKGLLAVFRDVTAERLLSAQLKHQASHDALTDLYNRDRFREIVQDALDRGDTFGVLFVDLDQFKVVNDSLGHEAGDQILREVSRRLLATLGGIGGAVGARLGGDEFGIMAPDAEQAAHQLLRSLREPFLLESRQLSISASIGVVVNAGAYDHVKGLLRDADTAMYQAKRSGRKQVALFTPSLREAASLRFGLEHDLRYAAAHDQIEPHYQPIVDLRTGGVVGFEALVRWNHPTRGVLSPGHFLPLAEELGLVVDLDRWVLRKACTEIASWGPKTIDALAYLNVNCSDDSFIQEDLIDFVLDVAAETGLSHQRLVLELTERALIEADVIRPLLEKARSEGVRVVIDDFGSGYSSLGLLHSLPVDGVKIDQTFISDLGALPTARAVVRAVVGLAGDLDMRIVAEGIETPDQLRALQAIGAHYGQGYLFARPAPGPVARQMVVSPPWAQDWESWTHMDNLASGGLSRARARGTPA
ncbi:MAG: EAL domain-containing protein [Bacteroidota bacterium]